jgi:hypothetical protein
VQSIIIWLELTKIQAWQGPRSKGNVSAKSGRCWQKVAVCPSIFFINHVFESHFNFPDRCNTFNCWQRLKTFHCANRWLRFWITIESPFKGNQGLLRLESRKSQQLLKPFDLDFVFLDQNIKGSYWLPIIICAFQGYQIWIRICYVSLQSWTSSEQSIISVWKIDLRSAVFCTGLNDM